MRSNVFDIFDTLLQLDEFGFCLFNLFFFNSFNGVEV